MQNKDILNQKEEERLPLFPEFKGFAFYSPSDDYKGILANRMQYWESREDCGADDVAQMAIEEANAIYAAVKMALPEKNPLDPVTNIIRDTRADVTDSIKNTDKSINSILWTTGILLAITDALLIALLTHLW